MSSSQPGNPSLEKLFFLFSDLAVKAAKSENKKNVFQRLQRHGVAAG